MQNVQNATSEIEPRAAATVRRFLSSIEACDVTECMSYCLADATAYRMRPPGLVASSIKRMLEAGFGGDGALATATARSIVEKVNSLSAEVIGRPATVWVDCDVLIDGAFHHGGGAIFSLIEDDEFWRIASIIDEATRLATTPD